MLKYKQCSLCGKHIDVEREFYHIVKHGRHKAYYCFVCTYKNNSNGGKENESKQETREH